ncbi:MAG: hypothetical protein CMJ78_00710 [Planctomycetaceae bacterium]|nr:hypothetical protein [Planctomycetaceae bacterium]
MPFLVFASEEVVLLGNTRNVEFIRQDKAHEQRLFCRPAQTIRACQGNEDILMLCLSAFDSEIRETLDRQKCQNCLASIEIHGDSQ